LRLRERGVDVFLPWNGHDETPFIQRWRAGARAPSVTKRSAARASAALWSAAAVAAAFKAVVSAGHAEEQGVDGRPFPVQIDLRPDRRSVNSPPCVAFLQP